MQIPTRNPRKRMKRQFRQRGIQAQRTFYDGCDSGDEVIAEAALAELVTNISSYPRLATLQPPAPLPHSLPAACEPPGTPDGSLPEFPCHGCAQLRLAFVEAQRAVARIPDGATTLLLAIAHAGAIDLGYVGDGFAIVVPSGATAIGNLVVPQHNPAGHLTSCLSRSIESRPVFMHVPITGGGQGLAVLLGSDGLALESSDASVHVAAQTVLDLAGRWPLGVEDVERALADVVRREDLRHDNRTVAVLVTPQADRDWRRARNALEPAGEMEGLLAGATDAGPKTENEDAIGLGHVGEMCFVAVADGVGSSRSAARASAAAVEAVAALLRRGEKA